MEVFVEQPLASPESAENKKHIFLGGREGGKTNERPGTDLVISGPMRGLEKNCTHWRKQTDRQTDTHTSGYDNSMTESSQWARFSKNTEN